MRARRTVAALAMGAVWLGACALMSHGAEDHPVPAPPAAPVQPVTDEYFGVKVTDPYRYMEDLKDPQVQSWFKAQNARTRSALDAIAGRTGLLARITELDQSAPARVFDVRRLPGGRLFYQKRLASEDMARLYVREGIDGPEKLLLDPGKYPAPKNSHNAISYYAPSDDGSLVAAGVSAGGSENAVLHLVRVDSAQDAGEAIDRTEFGEVFWRPDNHSFFYNRLQKLGPDQPPIDKYLNSRVYLHTVGKDPDADPAVMGAGLSPEVKAAPADAPVVATDPASSYAFGMLAHGVQREITAYAAPLASVAGPQVPWQKICDVDQAVINGTVHGDDLYLLTHKDVPRFKLVRTSLAHPDVDQAEVIIPEGPAVLMGTAAAKDAIYVQELDGGIGRLVRVSYGGKAEEVPLPFEGAVEIAASDSRVPGVLLSLTSWTRAPAIYAYDPQTRQVTDTHLQPAGKFDHPQDVVSEEVKVASYDGTLVPLSIVHRRDVKLDGSHPTLLTGYGAYGITLDPWFDVRTLAWFEHDGVMAVAHVRGGGEYGEQWHKDGQKLTKPNTWRDFIACGEYLIEKKYTTSARLAGAGTSAGGITIGRAITERPDLFAAALDRVGVCNALRAEKSPNGPPNIPEFGSTATQEGFEDLYAMDAYHHVRDGVHYPAVLLTTGFNDPRVDPWEPGKMAARLQAATSGGKPILLRVDYDAGHGFGSTRTQIESQLADEWGFLLWQFDVPGFEAQ